MKVSAKLLKRTSIRFLYFVPLFGITKSDTKYKNGSLWYKDW